MTNNVSNSNPTKSRSWLWCDACGRKTFVSRAAKWKAAQSTCSHCGCSRLMEQPPEQSELQWEQDGSRYTVQTKTGWKWKIMVGGKIIAEGVASSYPACNREMDQLRRIEQSLT